MLRVVRRSGSDPRVICVAVSPALKSTCDGPCPCRDGPLVRSRRQRFPSHQSDNQAFRRCAVTDRRSRVTGFDVLYAIPERGLGIGISGTLAIKATRPPKTIVRNKWLIRRSHRKCGSVSALARSAPQSAWKRCLTAWHSVVSTRRHGISDSWLIVLKSAGPARRLCFTVRNCTLVPVQYALKSAARVPRTVDKWLGMTN
jgi:hypothetical protein